MASAKEKILSHRSRRTKRLDNKASIAAFKERRDARLKARRDSGEKWITVNGAHVQSDKDGKLKGNVGKKISNRDSAKTARKPEKSSALPKNTLTKQPKFDTIKLGKPHKDEIDPEGWRTVGKSKDRINVNTSTGEINAGRGKGRNVRELIEVYKELGAAMKAPPIATTTPAATAATPVTAQTLQQNASQTVQQSYLEQGRANREAHIKIAHEREAARRNLDHEEVTAIGHDGTITENIGSRTKANVRPPIAEGAIITHNHPDGGPLSSDDIKSFVKHNLLEMRASAPSGEVYSIMQAPGNTVSRGLSSAYSKMLKAEVKRVSEDAKSKSTSNEEAEKYFNKNISSALETWLENNQEKYGYIYTKEG
jgi:hypothetical protein